MPMLGTWRQTQRSRRSRQMEMGRTPKSLRIKASRRRQLDWLNQWHKALHWWHKDCGNSRADKTGRFALSIQSVVRAVACARTCVADMCVVLDVETDFSH